MRAFFLIYSKKTDYSDGIFYAKEILAKHDENYIPKEVKKALVNDS